MCRSSSDDLQVLKHRQRGQVLGPGLDQQKPWRTWVGERQQTSQNQPVLKLTFDLPVISFTALKYSSFAGSMGGIL